MYFYIQDCDEKTAKNLEYVPRPIGKLPETGRLLTGDQVMFMTLCYVHIKKIMGEMNYEEIDCNVISSNYGCNLNGWLWKK